MAEFEPIPDPPTPEQRAAELEHNLREELKRIRVAMTATAGQLSSLAFELVREGSRNVERLGVLAASTSKALETAERAGQLLANPQNS
jgi:hypothetical protein